MRNTASVFKFEQAICLVRVEQDWRETFSKQRERRHSCSHLLRPCSRCKEKSLMVSTTFDCMDTQVSRCLGCQELWWESEFRSQAKRSDVPTAS